MIKDAKNMIKDINAEVEQNVAHIKRKKDEVRALEKELKQLEKDKTGNESVLQIAEHQARVKQNELQKAREALEVARAKLNAGREERRKAQLAAKIIWAIPIIGWIGASVATVVDCTALKNSVKASEHGVDITYHEYSKSKEALMRAQNTAFEVNKKMSALEHKKRNKVSKVNTLNAIVEKLKSYQRLVISLNEDVENLDLVLGLFYGKIKVLAFETDGGYSIHILKPLAIKVIVALSKLMQCDIIKSTCGASETKEIWKNLMEM